MPCHRRATRTLTAPTMIGPALVGPALVACIAGVLASPVATQAKPSRKDAAQAFAIVAHQPKVGLAYLPPYYAVAPEHLGPLLTHEQRHVRARAAILLRKRLHLALPESTVAATNAAIIRLRPATLPTPQNRWLTMPIARRALAQLADQATMPTALTATPDQLTAQQRQGIAKQLIQLGAAPPRMTAPRTLVVLQQSRGLSSAAPDPTFRRIETGPLPDDADCDWMGSPTLWPSAGGLAGRGPGGPHGPGLGWQSENRAPDAPRSLPGTNRNRRALSCFRTAILLDEASVQPILSLAINTPDENTRTRALVALEQAGQERMQKRLPPLPDDGADLLVALLDTPGARNQLAAARILEHMVQRDSNPKVIAAIHRRAKARLRRNFDALQLRQIHFHGCYSGSRLALLASDVDTQLVMTSARLGNRDLSAPLTDDLLEHPSRRDAHTTFLIECLDRLAPFVSPPQAARLFRPLAPYLRPLLTESQNAAGLRTLFRLYASVDDELLPLLERWHTGRHERQFWASVASVAEQLTNERMQRLLQLALESSSSTSDQQTLRNVLRARTSKQPGRRTAWGAKVWDNQTGILHAHHPLDLVRSLYTLHGTPADAAYGPVPVEHQQRTAHIQATFARAIRACMMRPDQLRELAELAEDQDHEIVTAAVSRAHWLSDKGRAWCQECLTRLAERASLADKFAALKQAVYLGIAIDNWRTTAEHLLTTDDEQVQIIAKAAHVRFDKRSEAPSEQPSEAVIACVRHNADLATVRKCVLTVDDFHAFRHTTGTRTTIALLEHAATFAGWPKELERRILRATTDALPAVRRAAYAAIATRDASESILAWLAYEAEFDCDDTVRKVARDLQAK